MRHLIEVRTHNAWVHASIAEVAYPVNLTPESASVATIQAISAGSPVNADIVWKMFADLESWTNIDVVNDELVTLSYPKINPWMTVKYQPSIDPAADDQAKMFVFDKIVFGKISIDNIDHTQLIKAQHHIQLDEIARAVQYIAVKVDLNTQRHTLMPNHKQIKDDKGKVDHVTIPTVEAGFDYGLSTQGFTGYLQQPSPQSFSRLKRNCADHVSRVMKYCQHHAKNFDVTQQLQQTEKSTHSLLGVSNPNVRLPWGKTIKSYAKIIRQHILQATINDAKNLLTPAQKIHQVIEIEMLRLQDGIHNINNSCVAIVRQKSLAMKKAKLQALRLYKQQVETCDEATMISMLSALCDNVAIKAGMTRHKTADHLRQLLAAVQPEYEQVPQGMTA
ncbi:MAG: hypothetical protein P1U40_00085 [Coxiellaceae bacterium]|nr:hypothetical protein [Coxiellaceae bacterium]